MTVHHLRTEQVVPRHRDEVFAFFSRPENLAGITPPWLRFATLTPSPVPMRRGAVVDYRITLGVFPARWRSLISTCEPPSRFVDEQILGPYSFWHHTHVFEDVPGGTLIRDHVRYLMPFGPLGEIAHALVVRRVLQDIFAHRRRVIAGVFGAGPARESA